MEHAILIGHLDSQIQKGEDMINHGDFHEGVKALMSVNKDISELEKKPDNGVEILNILKSRRSRCSEIILKGMESITVHPPTEMGPSSTKKNLAVEDVVLKPDNDVFLEDIIGMEEAKLALTQAILLPNAQVGSVPVANQWRGILLYGSSGVGKSKVVRAFANSIARSTNVKVTFLNITLDKVNGAFHGDTEKNLSEIFKLAESSSPAILVIDEIDALCSKRTEGKRESSEVKIVNHFLSKMDGLTSTAPIVLVGTTNKVRNMDEAFYRRFHKMVYVELPNKDAREQLFRTFIGRIQPREASLGIDFERLADGSFRFSPADICRVVTQAVQDVRYKNMSKEVLHIMEKKSDVDFQELKTRKDVFRHVTFSDLLIARGKVSPSNSEAEVGKLDEFASRFGGKGPNFGDLRADLHCISLDECVDAPCNSSFNLMAEIIRFLFD